MPPLTLPLLERERRRRALALGLDPDTDRGYERALIDLGECPIEAGFIGKLADHECEHGRLAGDRTPPCGCWSQEPAHTPDLMTILKPREEPRMDATAPETSTTPTPDAPFGFKADGTPRKRPAPSRAQIEKATAGRRAAAVARNGASRAVTPAPESATTVESPFLVQMLASLDAEIARLELARTKIKEALAA